MIFTPIWNIKKNNSLDVGQVAFHDEKLIKRVSVEKDAELAKSLEKLKEEIDIKDLKEKHDRVNKRLVLKANEIKRAEKEEKERFRREKEEKSYSNLFNERRTATQTMSSDSDL